MNGLTIVCLVLVAAVSAQYERRTVGRLSTGIDRIGRDSQWGRVRRPGDIIRDGIIDRTRRRDFIDDGFFRNDCYQYEIPSFWNGRIDTCSYLNQQCYNPNARCRITGGRRGTCCEPRRHNLRNRCYNNTPGQGTCHSDRDCRRQFGRSYECQFQRGSYGHELGHNKGEDENKAMVGHYAMNDFQTAKETAFVVDEDAEFIKENLQEMPIQNHHRT